VFHCCIFQSFSGTPRSIDVGIPSVDLRLFEVLLAAQRSLRSLGEHLAAFGHLPVAGIAFENRDVSLKFGDFTVVWEGYELK